MAVDCSLIADATCTWCSTKPNRNDILYQSIEPGLVLFTSLRIASSRPLTRYVSCRSHWVGALVAWMKNSLWEGISNILWRGMRELKRYSTQLFEVCRGTPFQVSELPVVRMPSHPASWHRRLIKVVILLWTSQHLPPFLLSDGIRWMSLCYCWGQHCFRIGRRKVGRSIGVVREVLTLLTRGSGIPASGMCFLPAPPNAILCQVSTLWHWLI